jgi:hypothetical protein
VAARGAPDFRPEILCGRYPAKAVPVESNDELVESNDELVITIDDVSALLPWQEDERCPYCQTDTESIELVTVFCLTLQQEVVVARCRACGEYSRIE